MKRELIPSAAFDRAAKRCVKRNPQVRDAIRDALALLEADAFHARLRTHKLKGKLVSSWACSVEYDLRIVFRFVQQDGQEAILLESMGTHDEVY